MMDGCDTCDTCDASIAYGSGHFTSDGLICGECWCDPMAKSGGEGLVAATVTFIGWALAALYFWRPR